VYTTRCATDQSICHAIDASKESEAAWWQLHLCHSIERTKYEIRKHTVNACESLNNEQHNHSHRPTDPPHRDAIAMIPITTCEIIVTAFIKSLN
jgi:hypothetical protein